MMSPIQTRPLPVTVVAVLFALILGIASIAVGSETYPIKFVSWQNVQPTVAMAVFKAVGGDTSEVDVVRIKVGYPYKLEKYDLGAKVKWTTGLFWHPGRATAKRVFEVYDLSKMNSEDWKVLRKAYSKNPVLMAFIMATDDD